MARGLHDLQLDRDKNARDKMLLAGFVPAESDGYAYYGALETDYDHPALWIMNVGPEETGFYYVIFGLHASGTNPRMNIGAAATAEDVIAVYEALKRLY